ncbi:MAG: hypothetical protein ACYSU1_08030 [Planctomycetota bacterium]
MQGPMVDATQVQDARGLLNYHLAASSLAPLERAKEANTLERAFVYLRSGAEGELREEIRALTEEHPDALRFAMQADCWNPSHFPAGLTRAQDWLERFPERPEAETASVREIQGFLQAATARRNALLSQRSSGSWYPFAAVLAFGMLVVAAARLLP